MAKINYHLHLKGYVGGWDFDSNYVDYILGKNKDKEVYVLIDSLGGKTDTALSIYAAFKRHGNVSVHFVGMNASAATIASLGAKRITMDKSAMYLVHKCSYSFFEWAMLNADDMQKLIERLEKAKKNLDKTDANVAEMYAAKCKKTPEEMLALMKEGGWLTSAEALEWGFIDEITDEPEEKAPVIDTVTAQAMADAGIPMPKGMKAESAWSKFMKMLSDFIKGHREEESAAAEETTGEAAEESTESTLSSNPDSTESQQNNNQQDRHQSQNSMKKIFTCICALLACQELTVSEGKITLDEAQMDTIEGAMAANKKSIDDLNSQVSTLQEENKTLKAEVESLKKKPAEETTTVVESKVEKEKGIVAEFADKVSAAQSLYDEIS